MLFLLACVLAFTATAQANSDTSLPLRKVYVLRPSAYTGALVKIKVSVNGHMLELPNSSFGVIECRADSVVLKLANSRLSGESVRPLVTYRAETYYVTVPEPHAHKKGRLILTEVEKDSYDFYARKVSRQIYPNP